MGIEVRRSASAVLVAMGMAAAAPSARADTFSGRVLDAFGDPVAGAHVSVNRTDRAATDADGRFTVDASRGAGADQVIVAARGYLDAWLDLDPAAATSDLALRLEALSPDADPYEPAPPETCAACHRVYADGWGSAGRGFRSSAHSRASRNVRVLDVFLGTASGRADATRCVEAGGRFDAVTDLSGVAVRRCYVDPGFLADANTQCGHDGEPRCDDRAARPFERPTAFGDCAGCHAPGAAIALPAALDLEAAQVAGEASAVTCEVCHRLRDTLAPDLPGVLRGALLWRAQQTDTSLALGPLDDVATPKMRAGWSALHAQSRVCSPCHQDTVLAAGTSLRWPEGVPSGQTFEEWSESPYAQDGPRRTECQDCHMPSLDVLGVGLSADARIASPDGPIRPAKQMHAHDFDALTSPAALHGALPISVEARQDGCRIVVTASITNRGVGHAFPSGDTGRNALLRITASAGATRLVESGGEVLPTYAGAFASGVVGSASGDRVVLDRDPPVDATGLELRVWRVRPTFHDYVGTGLLRGAAPSDKGLHVTEALGRFHVLEAHGRELRIGLAGLSADALGGAVYALGDDRHLAGVAGLGLAKVNRAADGARNVPFWRAVDLLWDNRLVPDETQASEHVFAIPDRTRGQVVVTATLLYRRAFAGVADLRGWTDADVVATEASARVSLTGIASCPAPEADAGTSDAGDAGSGLDASLPDAAPVDSGTTPAPPGCGCRVGRPTSSSTTSASWLICVALAAVCGLRRGRTSRVVS